MITFSRVCRFCCISGKMLDKNDHASDSKAMGESSICYMWLGVNNIHQNLNVLATSLHLAAIIMLVKLTGAYWFTKLGL